MRRPRACLAKHAPGRRRGSAWGKIGAARQELADGWPSAVPRLRQPGAGNGSKAREARRARETGNEKRGPAQQERRRDGAAGGAPCFREGTRALKEQWLRHLARHPPRICAGEKRRNGDGPTRGLAKQYGLWRTLLWRAGIPARDAL